MERDSSSNSSCYSSSSSSLERTIEIIYVTVEIKAREVEIAHSAQELLIKFKDTSKKYQINKREEAFAIDIDNNLLIITKFINH